ncbi:MAG: hypothetical protein PHG05_01380 [Candidatus Nanoarchaeia archaeon]|nr:hypothetical protein [Candidatus Nanoarchaeia archaeon]
MDKKRLLIFVSLVAMVLLFLLSETIFGYVVYPSTTPAASGGDILDIYYDYANWIDFILFLMIFLGIGQLTLGQKFTGPSKIVFVAVGIVLALALLIWENKTQFYLLEEFGGIIFWILIILLIIYLIKKFSGSMGGFKIAIPSIILLAYFILYGKILWIEYIFEGFATNYPLNAIFYSPGLYNILFFAHWISLFVLIWFIIKAIKDRKSES